MSTVTLEDGYDRKKKPDTREFRYMTPDEARKLTVGQEVYFQDASGKRFRRLRISGQVKTWKMDPKRVEVPAKYGMYENGRFTADGDRMTSGGGAALLVPSES